MFNVYLERGASQVHKLIAEHIGKVPAKTATRKKKAMKAKKKAKKKDAGDETAQLKFSKLSSPSPPQHYTKLQRYCWKRYHNEAAAASAMKKKAMKAMKK